MTRRIVIVPDGEDHGAMGPFDDRTEAAQFAAAFARNHDTGTRLVDLYSPDEWAIWGTDG